MLNYCRREWRIKNQSNSMSNSSTYKLFSYSLLAFSFCLPISIALVQPAAYLAALLAIYYFITNREAYPGRFELRTSILLFMAVVIISAFVGVRTGHSFEKMNRFVLFFIAWAIPYSLTGVERPARLLERYVIAFVLGATLKAAYDLVRIPAAVQFGIPLFETGNMRDPQVYYVAICLAIGMLMTHRWKLRYPPAFVSLFILFTGFIIHFKRGAWAACLGALAIMAIASRKWRYLALIVLFGAVLASLPQTRERIGQIQHEFDLEAGGRFTLWTQVAPELIKQHPAGMGWKGVTHEDFLAVADNIEEGLNHLHNNILQITLELNIVGLIVWLYLIFSVYMLLVRGMGSNRSGSVLRGISLGALGAFTGLMLNGLVEYNFGDSEVFMMILLIMGLGSGVSLIRRSAAN